MRSRRDLLLRRILPVLLAAPFVAVAAVHVVALFVAARVGEVDLLDGGDLLFEPRWAVADLRSPETSAADPGVKVVETLRPASGFGESVSGGTWLAGEPGLLTGHSGGLGAGQLVVRLRVAPRWKDLGEVRVAVRVNDVELGERPLGEGFRVPRWPFRAGAVGPGPLTVEIAALTPRPAAGGRSVLVSGIALVEARGVAWRELLRPPAILGGMDDDALMVRQPGVVVAPIARSHRRHHLRLSYWFDPAGERAWPEGRGVIRVAGTERSPPPAPIDAGTWIRRRLTLPAGQSDGAAAVEIRLDALTPGAAFVVDDLRLEPDL